MIQIKARIAGKASAPARAPYLRPVGNGAPLSRAATQSWVILDVPNLLIYEDRPKRALAWTDGVIHSAGDELQRRLDALPRKRTLRLCVA